MTPLQVDPLPVAGTYLSLALFLSLTAHVAARNVLGAVPARRALGVGPLPAAVAVVVAALSLPAALGVVVALLLDWLLFARLYSCSGRLAAYVTAIHAVVSVVAGSVVVALVLLIGTAPG